MQERRPDRSPSPPDFQEIQRVFYELHSANEFQDAEFINLMFPLGYELVDPPHYPGVRQQHHGPLVQKKSRWTLFMDLLSQFPKNLKLQEHIRNRLDMIKKRQLQILTANFNKQPDKKDATSTSQKKDDSLSPTRKNTEGGGKGKKAKKPQVNPLAMLAQSGLSPAE